MQQFIGNLHPLLRCELRNWLEGEIATTYLHSPLGPSFSLDRLFGKILARLTHDGHQNLALQAPRDHSQSTQLVRAVNLSSASADTGNDNLLIAAIATVTSCSCFLCAKDHLLMACPLLEEIRKDGFRRKALLRALDSQRTSNPPTSTGTGRPTTQIHALATSSPPDLATLSSALTVPHDNRSNPADDLDDDQDF
jgi:hypothetical protein